VTKIPSISGLDGCLSLAMASCIARKKSPALGWASVKENPHCAVETPKDREHVYGHRITVSFRRQHFGLSVAIGRAGFGIAIRSRHVGRVALLQPRWTPHQQTGADAQCNEHLPDSHLTSLTAKIACTSLSVVGTIRKRRKRRGRGCVWAARSSSSFI
jgi:hypothetical protein